MSSLWTPGGGAPREQRPPAGGDRPGQDRPAGGGGAPDDFAFGEEDEDELGPEEAAARMEELREQLARTPAADIVANHAFGLFELAALHLSFQPPNLAESQLAIDAMAALVERLGDRLGDAEAELRQGLAQLRLAFVQIRVANLGAAVPPPEPADP